MGRLPDFGIGGIINGLASRTVNTGPESTGPERMWDPKSAYEARLNAGTAGLFSRKSTPLTAKPMPITPPSAPAPVSTANTGIVAPVPNTKSIPYGMSPGVLDKSMELPMPAPTPVALAATPAWAKSIAAIRMDKANPIFSEGPKGDLEQRAFKNYYDKAQVAYQRDLDRGHIDKGVNFETWFRTTGGMDKIRAHLAAGRGGDLSKEYIKIADTPLDYNLRRQDAAQQALRTKWALEESRQNSGVAREHQRQATLARGMAGLRGLSRNQVGDYGTVAPQQVVQSSAPGMSAEDLAYYDRLSRS